MELITFVVGQPMTLPPLPVDGCRYDYVDGHHLFVLAFTRLAREEIELFNTARVKLGFIREPGAIIFVLKFHKKFQQSASLNWHLLPPDSVLPNDPTEPTHAAATTLVLVDRPSNTVTAIRTAALTNRFTLSLNAAMRKHASTTVDENEYQRALSRLDEDFDRLWALVDDACLLGGVSR
jgi:hypothetical protein